MSTNAKILVCDDDPLMVELIEFRLAAKGFEVVTAEDGQAALELARTERPDLIILDAMMPRTDGFQALAALKADPALATIPVIMLTARRAEKDILAALESGADDYLVKPFIPDELFARLSKILARKAGGAA